MDLGGVQNIQGIDSADHIIITGDFTNFGSSLDAETILNRLKEMNPNILAVAGNLDQPEVAAYLEDLEISLHGCGVIIDNLGIMGLGGSNFTPFKTPYEFSEEELASLLTSGYDLVKDTDNFILVSHTPPFKTETDKLSNGAHVGSTSVRTFIEQHQPLLCMTGHIHESIGQDIIGRTLILNPGMIKDGGYIEVDFENNELSVTLRP